MDILVLEGQTKAPATTVLSTDTLSSAVGEHAMLLLQVGASADAAKALRKEATSLLQQSLLEGEGAADDRLDSTLKELNGLFRGLLMSKAMDDVHAIVAIVTADGVLHVSHAGRAEAYVIRAGAASQITEYSKGKPAPSFIHIASGQLEERDVVVLSTQRLLRTVTPAQLAQLAAKPANVIDELKSALSAEDEAAAFTALHVQGKDVAPVAAPAASVPSRRSRGGARRTSTKAGFSLAGILAPLSAFGGKIGSAAKSRAKGGNTVANVRQWLDGFYQDLRDPQRKKRAHLLLLAAIVAVFLVVWAVVNLTTLSQQSQTRAELEQLVEQIDTEIRTAENRYLAGDRDAANSILERAEERTQQVLNDDRGLFRTEGLDLFDRIRAKREEINNIVRLAPRVLVNLASRKASVTAIGMIGYGNEEFEAYDRQDVYRVLHNSVEEPDRISEEELILNGTAFPRYETSVFQTTGDTVIETIADQPTSMKTDDPAGWLTGTDIATYLRYLYVLVPENNQIYKYERLSNRYGAPTEYNVSGDLEGGLDLAIDGNIYVLKEGGEIVKLLRGEAQPFVIRHAPEGGFANATKIYKVPEGNLYFLDPVQSRVLVATDGGATGESAYIKQYVLEGDEIGELQDLYVDGDEARLYVLDEKRIYSIDLSTQ